VEEVASCTPLLHHHEVVLVAVNVDKSGNVRVVHFSEHHGLILSAFQHPGQSLFFVKCVTLWLELHDFSHKWSASSLVSQEVDGSVGAFADLVTNYVFFAQLTELECVDELSGTEFELLLAVNSFGHVLRTLTIQYRVHL